MSSTHVAIDLGASSGRVIRGRFGEEAFELDVLHRFPNEVQHQDGHDHWRLQDLFAAIRTGLRQASNSSVASLGVDTWGVDYGLLDADGRLVEEPYCYRDARTDGVMERVFEIVPRAEVFRITGLQFMSLNTLYQWFAHVHDGPWPAAARQLLMLPDVFHHLLCGARTSEFTDASTSQLLDHRTRSWSTDLCRRLALPVEILPALVEPGTRLGPLFPALQAELGLPGAEVVACATHDTASAVAGTPLTPGVAFVSSGTWSLVGVERDTPMVNDDVARENFTNEGGLDGTVRLLKNVCGMWILEGCRKVWDGEGRNFDFEDLPRALREVPPFQAFLYPDDPLFFHPDDMVAAVRGFLRDTGQADVNEPIAMTRVILESLALRLASVVETLERLHGEPLHTLRVIGGGSQNDFLNQATASASGRPVIAGPVEATAIGNLLVQALAAGRFGSLAEGRRYVERMTPSRRFAPADPDAWQQARQQYLRVEQERTRA